ADIKDLTGNLLDQDRDGTGGEPTDDSYTATFEISDQASFDSADVPKHIDALDFLFGFGEPVKSTLTVAPNISVSDVNVKLNIYYPNDEELRIYLRSPSGTEVTLVDQAEGYGEGFADTIFDDEAPT